MTKTPTHTRLFLGIHKISGRFDKTKHPGNDPMPGCFVSEALVLSSSSGALFWRRLVANEGVAFAGGAPTTQHASSRRRKPHRLHRKLHRVEMLKHKPDDDNQAN